jgi:hypothetical protein
MVKCLLHYLMLYSENSQHPPSYWHISKLGILLHEHFYYCTLYTFTSSIFPEVMFKIFQAAHQWLRPVVLATCKNEIGNFMVQDQPRQTVLKTPSPRIRPKMDWMCGSSGRMPAVKHETLSSNPRPTPKFIRVCVCVCV